MGPLSRMRTSPGAHAANARSLAQNFFNNMVCQFPTLLGFMQRRRVDWDEFMEEQVDELNDMLARAYGTDGEQRPQ